MTMSDEKTQLMQSMDQKLAGRDTEGRTVLQMALLATVFVESPWRQSWATRSGTSGPSCT